MSGSTAPLIHPWIGRQLDPVQPWPTPSSAFPELTAREHEVLDLVARGMSNSEITRRLVVSPKTVRNHISNIFSKLQVADRAQAIVRAREAGLGGERRRDGGRDS